MAGHEIIELPHRRARDCAEDMLACMENGLEGPSELYKGRMSEDVIESIAEDCDTASAYCEDMLNYIIDTPYGRGQRLTRP